MDADFDSTGPKKTFIFWFLLVFFSAAGYIANDLRVELFFNVDYLFGSIFVMLAVKYMGRYAIVPAFIASLYTYTLWNHPYAIIICTAEAVFVSFLRRKDRDIIILDLFYWLTVGFVLIVISYHFIMDLDWHTTLLIVLKQSINGIMNAVTASLIFHTVNYYMKSTGRPYQQVYIKHIFFKLLVITAAAPSMIFIIFSMRSNAGNVNYDLVSRLNAMYNSASFSISGYLDETARKQQRLADNIAKTVSSGKKIDEILLDPTLLNILTSGKYMKNISVLDDRFIAVSMYAMSGGKPVSAKGTNFSDRDYFTDALNSSGVYISDITGDRSAIMVKPIHDESGYVIGYVQAELDFQPIMDTLTNLTADSEVCFTLTDRHGNILVSTNPEYDDTGRYSDRRSVGIAKDTNRNGIYLWTPRPAANVSIMTRWQRSYYIMSSPMPDGIPLKLIGELPLSHYINYMNTVGFNSLAVIFIMVILSVMSAWLLSIKLSHQITTLAEKTKYLPSKIYKGERIDWEQSIFQDIEQLTDNFRSMEEQLYDSFNALKAKSQELNLMLDAIPLTIFLKDTKNNVITGNRCAADMFGLQAEDLSNKPVKDIFPVDYGKYYDDDLQVIKSAKPVRKIIQRYITAKGERTVITDKIPLLGSYGDVTSILVISTDITEDIKAQEEKNKTLDALYQQAKMAEMGAMIGAITHQWRQPLNALGLVAQYIVSEAEDGTLSNESVVENARLIMDNVEFMNSTINDFTGFYKQDKLMETFKACETMREIYGLIDRQFIKNNINIEFEPHEHFEVYGLKNEFKQVCLNILNNAKEALISSGKQDKSIHVSYSNDGISGTIKICDNAGGINEDMMPDKLFEINSTTKSEGTGIGLYICTIKAENVNGGACFTITLPIIHS